MEKRRNEVEKCEKNVNPLYALNTFFRGKIKYYYVLIR
jgi:hypothetical protein